MMSQEDAYRQVYGRLAHCGVNINIVKRRNLPLAELEHLASTVEELWWEWERMEYHEKHRALEHQQMKDAGIFYCDYCPCRLEDVQP